jgi:hypothetical protein
VEKEIASSVERSEHYRLLYVPFRRLEIGKKVLKYNDDTIVAFSGGVKWQCDK